MPRGSKGNASPIRGGITRNAATSAYQQQASAQNINNNRAQQGRSAAHAGGKWAAGNLYHNTQR